MLSYLTKPFRGVENVLDARRDRSRAHAENQALKDELRRLQDVRRERDELARKLDALSQHMMVPPVEEHRIVTARAVSETRSPFAQAALVNAGTDKGVRAGSAVMSTNGLYGHILRVGDRSARILRLTDESSRISVKSRRSDARAILAGDDGPRPTLRFVDDPEDFRDGDLIVTSGDEGVLPEGLEVGTADGQGRVRLSETGRGADWVRIYVRAVIPAPEAPQEDDPNIIMRVIEVEPPVETPVAEADLGTERPQP
jgi:rod shape-determining protein MreC